MGERANRHYAEWMEEERKNAPDTLREFIASLSGGSPELATKFVDCLENVQPHPNAENDRIIALSGEIPFLEKPKVWSRFELDMGENSLKARTLARHIDKENLPVPLAFSGGSLVISRVEPGRRDTPEVIRFISESGSSLIVQRVGFFFIKAA